MKLKPSIGPGLTNNKHTYLSDTLGVLVRSMSHTLSVGFIIRTVQLRRFLRDHNNVAVRSGSKIIEDTRTDGIRDKFTSLDGGWMDYLFKISQSTYIMILFY